MQTETNSALKPGSTPSLAKQRKKGKRTLWAALEETRFLSAGPCILHEKKKRKGGKNRQWNLQFQCWGTLIYPLHSPL